MMRAGHRSSKLKGEIIKTIHKITIFLFAFCLMLTWQIPVQAVRIKDLVDIKGARRNHLVGYGLVVGLFGTGDGKNSVFTSQSLAALLDKMGVTVDPEQLKGDNVAAVSTRRILPSSPTICASASNSDCMRK